MNYQSQAECSNILTCFGHGKLRLRIAKELQVLFVSISGREMISMVNIIDMLHSVFTNPYVVSIITAYEAGEHLVTATKAIKNCFSNDSMEYKTVVVFENALERTCTKYRLEYDQLVITDLSISSPNSINSDKLLSELLNKILGPAFSSEILNDWIDELDKEVAKDAMLSNYLVRKALIRNHPLYELQEPMAERRPVITNEDNERLRDLFKFYPGNQLALDVIMALINNNEMFIPFVGEGVSRIYPEWRYVLEQLIYYLPREMHMQTKDLISKGEYLEVSDIICKNIGYLTYQTFLRKYYSEEKITEFELIRSPAWYIPLISQGNCITSNYDRVIERASILHGIKYDVAGFNDTYKLAAYLRNPNRKGLIFKIHGDVLSNEDSILISKKDFNDYYNPNSKLLKHLKNWISGRQLLFIDNGLFENKIVDVLLKIYEEGMVNYAIYPCIETDIPELSKKCESLGIIPVFYDVNSPDTIVTILKHLVLKQSERQI